MSGASQNKEERMNTLLTIAELQHRTESDLRALFRQASQSLARTASGTPERRNNLATLENIARALALAPGARGL
jgi:hypothetical protein